MRFVTSGIGTFAICWPHRTMSGLRGNPEDMCSCGVLLSLTQSENYPGVRGRAGKFVLNSRLKPEQRWS